jgi:hypothetical protein
VDSPDDVGEVLRAAGGGHLDLDLDWHARGKVEPVEDVGHVQLVGESERGAVGDKDVVVVLDAHSEEVRTILCDSLLCDLN